MVTYTDRLRNIYKRYGSTWAAIGLDRYPIFNADYRETLNQKILDHFWNEEIGVETSTMFVQSMRSRMNIIMPYYNQLYRTVLDDFDLTDILNEVDMTTESESTNVSTSEATSTASGTTTANTEDTASSSSNAKALNATYPQQQLNSQGRYATSGNESESHSNSTQESATDQETNSTTEANQSGDVFAMALSKQHGRSRSAAALIQDFRSAIINIDELIIADLEELFMLVWSVPHAYTPHTY